MVKTEAIFNQIAAIDTSLKFNAVIPSLADIQLKTINLLELLTHQLTEQGYEEETVDLLLRLFCRHIDSSAHENCRQSGLSWQGYSLEAFFYGYGNDDTDSKILTARLLNDSGPRDTLFKAFTVFLTGQTRVNTANFSTMNSSNIAEINHDIHPEDTQQTLAQETQISWRQTVLFCIQLISAGALLVGLWFFLFHSLR